MLHNLIQTRSKKVARMKELWSLKDEQKRSWSEAESKEYDQLSEETKKLQTEIDQRAEFQRYVNQTASVEDKKWKKQTQNVGILDVVKALIHKRQGPVSGFDPGPVTEMIRQAEIDYGAPASVDGSISIPPSAFKHTQNQRAMEFQRALTTADNSGGPAIQDYVQVPTLDVIFEKTVLKSISADFKELPQSTGTFSVPKMVDPTAQGSSAKAEGAALDTRSVTIENEISLDPRRVGRILVISNLWLRQAKDPSAIERTLLAEMATAIDKFSLNGTGSANNQPLGILKDADLLKVAATAGANVGDAITLDKILKAREAIELKNQVARDASFIINPKVKRKCSSILRAAASGAKFLFEDNMLLDRPTAVTNLMPSNLQKGTSSSNLSNIGLFTGELICVPIWSLSTLQISTDGSTWFSSDSSAMRIQTYFNCGLLRPDSSHCLIENLITEA